MELSGLQINADGKLCEEVKRGQVTVNRLFNCLRWDYDGSISFSFNPEFISDIGW